MVYASREVAQAAADAIVTEYAYIVPKGTGWIVVVAKD